MRVILAALCLSLVLGVPPRSASCDEKPAPAAQPDENERYPVEFRKRVNDSIDRGVAWLLKQQQPDGTWSSRFNKAYPMGPASLAVLTLLKGGVKADHPAVRKAFAHLRTLPMKKTYAVSVLLMAMDASYAPARDPFAVETVDRYGRSKEKDPCLSRISKEDMAWMQRAVTFLLEAQTTQGVWRYPSKQAFDLSCTQYALLGLKAALRCGIKVPPGVWLRALRFLLDHQEQDGAKLKLRGNEVRGKYRIAWSEDAKTRGFRYTAKKPPVTGAMTTAGISSLIICQSELWSSRKFKGDLRARARVGIRDAMAWMQAWMEVRVNPIQRNDGKPGHPPEPLSGGPNHYYYLYGLERASILGRVRFYGTRDWYEEGAETLMMAQEEVGGWPSSEQLTDSCFAILFLKRATSRMKVPVITPEAGGAPADSRSKAKKKKPAR